MKYEDIRLIDIELNIKNYIFPCDGDKRIVGLIPTEIGINARELTKEELKELRKMFPRRKRIGIRKV